MGLFKKLGSKLKRVVSIKNLVNVATGNFSAVAKDAVRVATTNAPVKGQPSTFDATFLPADYAIPPPVMQVVESQGKAFGQKVTSAIATVPQTQQVTSFLTGVYAESMFIKYKNWIYVIVGIIASFILYKVLGKKNTAKRGRYSR